MSYLDDRRNFINAGRPLPVKKKYKLKPVSDKRAAKILEEKEKRGDEETELQKWFNERRKELTGTCQCGCGNKSEKYSDKKFRASCCHIFPQRLFPSIELHPLNFVERAWEGGCHSNMDNRSMGLWPNFEDWENIKARFFVLEPLLTEKERGKKFFSVLSGLIHQN